MRKCLVGGLICFLLISSLPVWADKIIITGKPVVLAVHPGYFTFPSDYTDLNLGYYYVTITGTNRVCYLQKHSELASLDTIEIVIEKDNQKLPWFCYQYDTRYFQIDF